MGVIASRSGQAAGEKGHIPSLDGVRGLAILAVMAGHFLISNNLSPNVLIQLLLDIRDQTWMGVTLFFSLSGFLITGILYDTLGSGHYFRTFYGRRILRIFPVYYGFLLVLLLLTPVLGLNWHGQAYRLWTYTVNIPFVQDWSGDPAPYINLRHFWSLAVEEQFYLVWPFVVFWLRDWGKILAATVAGSVMALAFRTALVLFHRTPENHTLPGCMDALLLGGALALLVRSDYRERVLRISPWVFGIAATILGVAAFRDPFFSWENSVFLTTIGMTILGLGTTALVATCLVPGSLSQKVFSTRFLRFFGTYSYGLYVYHYSVGAAVGGPLRSYFLEHGQSKAVSLVLSAIPAAFISIVLAYLSYHLYEKHFLGMKRYFPYQRPVLTEVDALAVGEGSGG